MAGAHNIGDLGVVAHAGGGVAEVLLDATDTTVHVLVNNLVETAQERSTIEALGRYRTSDLVQLRDDSVGMIIRLSADTAHLLIPGMIYLLRFCSDTDTILAKFLPFQFVFSSVEHVK